MRDACILAERRKRLVDLVIVAFRSAKERSLQATFAERKATIFLRFRLNQQAATQPQDSASGQPAVTLLAASLQSRLDVDIQRSKFFAS
ncbi:hypothetical protein FF011L_38030 [Roseimaritima multifibrata]|uniref:Uncharacterized protein n=1 Tax=Roseimaritima multifibrata TaxID=1930274 RepID=A0A517MJF2_9BACT|nr:hypothetical protein FF011L_38030 [Roseimaritima multifibrata]